jgi:hypothetical protein
MNQAQLSNLRFCPTPADSKVDISKLSNHELTTWPPSDDFIVFYNEDDTGPAVSKKGESQGCFGDDYWNAKRFGHAGFNFAKQGLSDENKQILKELLFIHLWYMPLFPGKVSSLKNHFSAFSAMGRYADQHKVRMNEVLRMDELYKHSRLTEGLVSSFSPSQQAALISRLGMLHTHRDELGITLTSDKFLKDFNRYRIQHIPVQSAYIPPRIWMGVIKRCDEIIETYLAHRESVEKAIKELVKAYRHNQGVYPKDASPFNPKAEVPKKHHGNFRFFESKEFLADHNLTALLDKLGISTIRSDGTDQSLKATADILNRVEPVCFYYVVAHSIQRKKEALGLRFDCYKEDSDPTLGKVAMLCGETTKTDPDDDARWIVPDHVEKAIDCLKSISTLKHLGAGKTPTGSSPLFTAYNLPWNSGSSANSGNGFIDEYALEQNDKTLFDDTSLFPESLSQITAKDYAIAYQLTPRLTEKEWFKEGGLWHFTPHQFRRTLAANLFASGIPDHVIQWLMKHRSVAMSHYYGRNYSRLSRVKVDSVAADCVVSESIGMKLNTIIQLSDASNDEHVHAVGRNMIDGKIINLIEEKKYKVLSKQIKKGFLDARPTLLGLCMAPSCPYGGIESAAHCAGTDGSGPCKDAVFAKKNGPRLKKLLEAHKERQKELPEGDMERVALNHEINAIEVYFDATSSNS